RRRAASPLAALRSSASRLSRAPCAPISAKPGAAPGRTARDTAPRTTKPRSPSAPPISRTLPMLQDPADSATALTPAQPAADEERSLRAGVAADSDPPKGSMEEKLARAAVRTFPDMSRDVAIPFWMRHDALRESLRRRTERLERLRPSDFNDPARALIAEIERNPYVCGISFEKMTPKSPGRLAFRVLMRATLTLPGRNPETVY